MDNIRHAIMHVFFYHFFKEQNMNYLRPAQAAQELRIAKTTLYLWARTMPDFPPFKRIGGRVTLVDVDAVQIYLGLTDTEVSQ
jgi:predicted DNA-binding transcriptional regulator AlpA